MHSALASWYEDALLVGSAGALLIAILCSALVLAVLRLRKQHFVEKRLRLLANTDALTGLATRGLLDTQATIEWRRAKRANQYLSLIMIDVDRFKDFNDTYGHIAGDEALKAISSAILEVTRRASDLAARFGGEEFAVVLPGTSTTEALKIAEAIRQRVIALSIPHRKSEYRIVTVSLGVASYIPSAEFPRSLLALFRLADANLYAAKHYGRNAVMGPPNLPISWHSKKA